MQSEHLRHTIDPVFDARSRVLMLGSFPSPKSREVGFFYGHPQNRMWRVLTAVTGESAVPRTTEERTAFLLRNRIAMWDVIASCTIEGASDASIRNPIYQPVELLVARSNIQAVFFNGTQAHRLFLRRGISLSVPSFRMPSTSPANAAFSMERLEKEWSTLLIFLKE